MGNSRSKHLEVIPNSYPTSSLQPRLINSSEHIPVQTSLPPLPYHPASPVSYPQSSYPASAYASAHNPSTSKYPASSYPPKLSNSSFNSPLQIFSDAFYIPSSIKIVIPQLNNLPQNEIPISPVRFESRLFFISSQAKLETVNDQTHGITFEYTSLNNSYLTVYLLARERLDPYTKIFSLSVDETIQPKHKRFLLEKGENKIFCNVCQLNLKGIEKQALEFEDQIAYPIAIEIESQDVENGEKQTYFSYFMIATDGNSYSISNLKETVRIGSKYFRLHSLYGGKSINQESECIICLNELRTIALLPCRHICYCKNCAVEVSKINKSKCPVCRVTIDILLEIEELL